MIPVADVVLGDEEKKYVLECLETEWISSLGEFITKFESGFSNYCGSKYGVAVSNGTVALHLALVVLGIGPGDEVIVPTLTFIATANAVAYTGAKVVFADSDPETGNIDPQSVKDKITDRTKAIIVVHLYGHPVDMDPIMDVATKYRLFVIEDAAEAHGAEYKGKKVGSIGDIGTFSFYGNKILTTGEGGILLTNNPNFYERAVFLRDHAMSKSRRYWHPEIGFNYRLTNIQAALGLGQLSRIEEVIAHKRKVAEVYNQLLSNIPYIALPCEKPWARNVYWMYSPRIAKDSKVSRDDVISLLKKNGIDSRPFFYPIHTMPAYSYSQGERFPNAQLLSETGINLPSGSRLTNEQQREISRVLHNIFD